MPNITRNLLRMRDIEKKDLFTADDRGEPQFDFNKLVPMPKELDIPSGSFIAESVVYHMTGELKTKPDSLPEERKDLCKRIVMSSGFGLMNSDVNLDGIFESAKAYVSNKETLKSMKELGPQYCRNYEKYGHTNWYDWCCENWGTKWNAYDTYVHNDTAYFSTAWVPPLPIIAKLSESFPDENIYFAWAVEDRSCGKLRIRKGQTIEFTDYDGFEEGETEKKDIKRIFEECW